MLKHQSKSPENDKQMKGFIAIRVHCKCVITQGSNY